MTIAQQADVDVDKAVGVLRKKRKRLGLSLADVGGLIGVHRNTIFAWEAGKRRPPLQEFVHWKREIDERIAQGHARKRHGEAVPQLAPRVATGPATETAEEAR